MPFPVPTNRGYSPSVSSGWWKRIDGQLLLSPQQVVLGNHIEKENPFPDVEDKGVFDSGCSRRMTGRITGKGAIRTSTLDFENVYYVKELQQFNLFYISQIYDKKNRTEAVRTACYVLNRVLVISPRNKTPYALLTGNIPSVSHFKPFGRHVTILNISDHLGMFDGKADEGYIVRYSASNKAYRVYNVPNKMVEETMNL
nr:ribonuclease H-like domain-containing protein [Tanacetum cinerariifolium]